MFSKFQVHLPKDEPDMEYPSHEAAPGFSTNVAMTMREVDFFSLTLLKP